MPNSFPASAVVWQAIDIYMKLAYDGRVPSAVAKRLEALRQQPVETFFECDVLERDSPAAPKRCSLRLGNRAYPHMKLAIELSPEGSSFFFKADTHDKHCCPPAASPEYKMFLQLTESNEALAKQIESNWSAAGIPTFREFLRDDLARRQAAAGMVRANPE